jgi:hypothetical protein
VSLTMPRAPIGGNAAPSGGLHARVLRPWPAVQDVPVADLVRTYCLPRRDLSEAANDWRTANWRHGLLRESLAELDAARRLTRRRAPLLAGSLFVSVHRADGAMEPFGLASLRVVTTAGVNYIVADFTGGANDINLFKFHGLGTGTNAEATADTALQTELTTQYTADNTRPTGTQTTGGSANIYRTVGNIGVDATVAATEHGILTQAATGGGTLLDRSVFTVVNLTSGDTFSAQYDLTLPAGG